MEKKFDLKKYSQWCEENGFEASNPSAMVKYTEQMKKEAQASEKAVKIAKQKEIFEEIAKYAGKDIKYNEEAFESINEFFEAMLYAIAVATLTMDSIGSAKEIDELFFGGKNND